MATGGGKRAQSTDNYSVGKAMLRRLVKEVPACTCCVISPIVVIIIGIIIAGLMYREKPLTWTSLQILNDNLIVCHTLRRFIYEPPHTETVNEIILVSHAAPILVSEPALASITGELFGKQLRERHAIELSNSKVSENGIGEIALKGLSLNDQSSYSVIGICTEQGGDRITVMYQVDVTDKIRNYLRAGDNSNNQEKDSSKL